MTVVAWFAAVVLYVAAFPPLDQGWLGWLALVPWCVLARRLRGRRLFLAGYLAGAAILTIGCWWLRLTTPVNLLLMVVAESLYYGAAALLLGHFLVRRQWPATVALPLVWVPMEWLRGVFPFEGFPWLLLGYSQHGVPLVLQTADLWGALGVTGLLAAAAGLLVDLFRLPRSRPARLCVAGALLLQVGALGYGAWRWQHREDGVAGPALLLVQPDVPQALKMSYRPEEVIGLHLDLCDRALADPDCLPDVVVWSETILTPLVLEVSTEWQHEYWKPVGQRLLPELRRRGAWFLSGVLSWSASRPRDPRYNSAVLYDGSGERRGLTHKRVLVPGGEYLPLVGALPGGLARWVEGVVEDLAGFLPALEPGTDPGVMEVPDGSGGMTRAGVGICYEIAYPSVLRHQVDGGAAFLVNLSNEAWFPGSAEFDQYTAMARFRAVECRRAVVRCANSGTSGLIDAYGRPTLLEANGRTHDVAGTLVVRPKLRTGRTPFLRGGWVLPGVLTALLGLAILAGLRRDSRRKPVTQGPRSRL